jgi:hypothetical protein
MISVPNIATEAGPIGLSSAATKNVMVDINTAVEQP